MPMELSLLIFIFLKKAGSENKVQVKVTGSTKLEKGLVVRGSFLGDEPRLIRTRTLI